MHSSSNRFKKMNILLLNYEFPPLGGGAGNATFYLLKEFSKYPNLKIDLVTSSTDHYREEQFSGNIKIYFLDIKKESGKIHSQSNKDLLSYSYKTHFFCKRLLKTQRYDLCHAFFGIPCGFIAMRLKIPYLVSLRGSDVPFYNKRFYWLDKVLLKNISGRVWKRAERVIANSKGLRALALKSHPSRKIEVIHNGVDTDEFKPNYKRDNGLRLLCVSRLIKRKGIEHLIEAIADLKEYDISLVIAGEGDQKGALQNLSNVLGVTSKIVFKGYVRHDCLNELYSSSDVFILPSLNEGMSNTVLEAMACGLPIVITDTGGTAELFNENGFIIGKKNKEAIVEALQKFLGNKELITQMGKRSREIALKMNWRNAAEGYHNIYQSIKRGCADGKL